MSGGELTGNLPAVNEYDANDENITLTFEAQIDMPFAYSTDVLKFSQSNLWNETIYKNYVKMYVLSVKPANI